MNGRPGGQSELLDHELSATSVASRAAGERPARDAVQRITPDAVRLDTEHAVAQAGKFVNAVTS